MFEKFTERARKVMSLSRQAAQRLNHEFIGTEHMLLGILDEDGGVAAKAIKLLGIDRLLMMKEIEAKVAPNALPARTLGQLPFSPRAKKAIQLSEEEACRSRADVIGTEHLLLGLFTEKEGIAFQVMTDFKITELDLRAKMVEVLGPEHDRIIGPPGYKPKGNVTIKVWLFKAFEGQSSVVGTLFHHNVQMEVHTIILMEGIPSDRQEIVAASLARDLNASAYMIERIKK